MFTLVLLRHGQTVWNKEGRFTGWTDVELTEQGIAEAHHTGLNFKQRGYVFDEAHTNVLKRCVDTTNIVLAELGQAHVPVNQYWRLNERNYGALQGLSHAEMELKYSPLQVLSWRRSVYDKPPLLEISDPRYPGNDPKYKEVSKDDLPRGESLYETLGRVEPYIEDVLFPAVKSGKRILVSASHNSLRAIVKHIENMTETEIGNYVIPTGGHIVYYLDDSLNMIDVVDTFRL